MKVGGLLGGRPVKERRRRDCSLVRFLFFFLLLLLRFLSFRFILSGELTRSGFFGVFVWEFTSELRRID